MIIERYTEQRIKLRYDVHIPDTVGGKPLPLLIALHGYEGNKESMMALAQRINSTDFIIASVQAPNAFMVTRSGDQSAGETRIGFGWMMQYRSDETIDLHHRTIRSIISDVQTSWPVDARGLFLLAFSQAVSLNYRFAFTNPGTIRGVVAVCGGIPGDWDDPKYRHSDTDVLIIAAESDQFYPLERSRSFKGAIARRAGVVDFFSFPTRHLFPRESLPVINRWLLQRVTLSKG
jgi:predicted esterase